MFFRLYESYDKYIVYTYIIGSAKSWLVFIIQLLSGMNCVIGYNFMHKYYFLVLFLVFCLLGVCFMKTYTPEQKGVFDTFLNDMDYLSLALVCLFQICFALQRSSVLGIDATIAFDTLSVVESFKMVT